MQSCLHNVLLILSPFCTCFVTNPTLFIIPCIFEGIIDLQCCNYYHLPSDLFHPNFNQPWQYFITSWSHEEVGFWPHSSIIHDHICSLIHKKCHPKNYYSDMNYLVTLNIIYIVLINTRNTAMNVQCTLQASSDWSQFFKECAHERLCLYPSSLLALIPLIAPCSH